VLILCVYSVAILSDKKRRQIIGNADGNFGLFSISLVSDVFAKL